MTGTADSGKLFEFSMIKQLRANYSLLPIVFIGVFGLGLSAFQIVRTLSLSPDISINKKSNQHPFEKYLKEDGKHVQYKYYSTMNYDAMTPHPDRPKL